LVLDDYVILLLQQIAAIGCNYEAMAGFLFVQQRAARISCLPLVSRTGKLSKGGDRGWADCGGV